MKNKLVRITVAVVMTLCLGTAVTSCSVEDGVDGTNGLNGVDGADGTAGADGADGSNGENGLGFDDLVKYGSIKLNLSGQRPDGEVFTDSTEFRFYAVESEAIEDGNLVFYEEPNYEFDVIRYISTPDDVVQEAYVDINLEVEDAGLPTQDFSRFELEIHEYAVIGTDLKYFEIDNDFEDTDEDQMQDLTITDYSFDEGTNNLKFNFAFTALADTNDTDHDLAVTGEVDVIVLEEVEPLLLD